MIWKKENYDMTIDELYEEYNYVLRPLLAEVEAQLERFPIGLLNEIRALHDHVARTHLRELDEKAKLIEIELARRHSLRVMLDCYKVLCKQGEVMVEEFRKDYRGVRLGEVDSGRFLPKFIELRDRARDLVGQAKKSERLGQSGREEALDLYQEAVIAYADLKDFLREQSQNLAWSASHQKRRFWLSNIITAIISFVMGCLAIWIMRFIFKFFNIHSQ